MDKKEEKLNKITILGSGTSTGIPIIGCQCEVCLSKNEKNRRFRTSIHLETKKDLTLLVDCTPDLRSQALANDIRKIDGVIITHEHADHANGLDDLRAFTFAMDHDLPVYMEEKISKSLSKRFDYILDRENVFKDKPILGGGIAHLKKHLVNLNEENKIANDLFYFFNLPHGHTKTLGFIHEKFAYIIDCNAIPKSVIEQLKNRKIDLLILDCVNAKKHNTHLTVETAFKYIREIKPKRCGLIHMGHDLDHQWLENLCKESFDFPVFPTFDGQILKY